MKYFLLISSLLTVAVVAQQPSLSCSYYFQFNNYHCTLTINNPNGLNDFTQIGGIHLGGFTNADVSVLYTFGSSTNMPRIICDTFPNLVNINLFGTGITGIDDTAFGGCSRVTILSLFSNRISSISSNAFVNNPDLMYLYLNDNWLTTLPENVFARQQHLTDLDLSDNRFLNLPGDLFRPLQRLRNMYLGNANLNFINNQWFATNKLLYFLFLPSNRITLTADGFVGLEGLGVLNLEYNAINEIPRGAFAGLTNLEDLILTGNNIADLPADSFSNLGHLYSLGLNGNPIQIIRDGTFRGLVNLQSLRMSDCRLRLLQSNNFEDLHSLSYLELWFNEIEELPQGVFANMPNLNFIGLWNNRLRTLHRSSFGSLTRLDQLDVEGNVISGIDRAIIDDAVNLDTLHFSGNLCASGYFDNFIMRRQQYLQTLENCFRNMQYTVETTTENNNEFSFFESSPNHGIVIRVKTDNEVKVALTQINFIRNPMIEIFIGTANNSRSVITMNQEVNVVTVPTPNIVTRDQWNDFKITWANQVILVYSGNNSFPFMSYTMQDLFPVNFYGLRSVDTRASWSVQPFE